MILEFDGVQFGFGDRPLLSGIYVKCETGKVTGLLGRNGSGKSTLLKIVFGALYAETLSVRINSKPVLPPAFCSREIVYLAQDSFIPNDLPLLKILKLYEVNKNRILDAYPEIEEDLLLNAGELSGGRRRLFEVLLLLNAKATFCLLDEPFRGLTPVFVERLHEVIQKTKMNKGIIITDHLYRQVINLSDTLYLLANGKTHLIKNQEDLIQRGYLLE